MTPSHPARSLPVLASHGGRSAMTCQYRCGNACAHPEPNASDNPYFGDLVAGALSRRGMLRAGALGALVIGAGGVAATMGGGPAEAAPAGAPPAAGTAAAGKAPGTAAGALTFKPIPPNTLDTVVVPNGYDQAVVLAWGDPVLPDAPAWDVDRQSPAAQAKQFGFNNDWLTTLPLDRRGRRLLLVVNHEYTNENLMFRDFTTMDAMTLEQIRTAIAAHGLSVVEIERVGDTGEWRPVTRGSRHYNRRITPSTRMVFTGPAVGSPLLRTAEDPRGVAVLGTLNNCAGGLTPWGTIVSGEENFNQYFVGGNGVPAEAKPALARYGFDTTNRYPSGSRKWERVEARFDLAQQPNEANRFGWIVEIDPYDPRSTPRKHTALGRVKHEGAEMILARDGRVVAYMGDDERFDYIYKFVSDKKMRGGDSPAARSHNMTLLESGTLYVARFGFTSADEIDGSGKLPTDGAFNGTGQWIPLVRGDRSLVPGMSVDQVLVHTRLAGDAVGATKMDRPEDVAPNPRTGRVYVALTNNTRRGAAGEPAANEANPRANNRHGHVLEIIEDGGDNAAETFTWTVPIVCGDPADPSTYFAGFDKSKVSPISCPDNLDFDAHGNLWISTDGNALGSHDGLFAVPVDGPERGHVKQFLTVPTGAEEASASVSDDNHTVFVSIQHPGEIDGASVDNPASTWPHGGFARPAVINVWRRDGREIGS